MRNQILYITAAFLHKYFVLLLYRKNALNAIIVGIAHIALTFTYQARASVQKILLENKTNPE